MHDVRATVAATRMTEAVLGFRAPAYVRHNAGVSTRLPARRETDEVLGE
jgi:hypothetical protein